MARDIHADGAYRPLSVHRTTTNGRAAATAEEPMSTPPLPQLGWQASYERSSVDRFVREVEVERDWLDGEIEATKVRIREAKAVGARRVEEEAELVALLVSAQRELAGMEQEHREKLDSIGARAEREAERLLGAAQREAETMRAATATAAQYDGRRYLIAPPADPPEDDCYERWRR